MLTEGQSVRVVRDNYNAGYVGEVGVVSRVSHEYVEVYLPKRNRYDENPFVLFERDELEGVN